MRDVQRLAYRITNAVHDTEDIGQLYCTIKEELSEFLATENFFIALYDREEDTISLPYFVDSVDQNEFHAFPAGKTMTAYVIKRNEPLLATREEADVMVETGEVEMIGTPSQVWLGVPLRVNEEVTGALVVQSYTDSEEFGKSDLELLTFASDQIGLAIERKRAMEELHKQREEMQTILDSMPALISYKDLDGRYIRVNRALAQATGIPQKQWVGKTAFEVSPDLAARYHEDDKEVIETGNPKLAIVEPFKTASGDGWLMTDKIPYLDRDGNTAGVVSLAIDITDRIRVEQELLDKEEELRQSQKMEAVGQLAGGIAHDFNNLLTAISGYTQLVLHRLEPDDPNQAFLKQVAEAAERAAALTHQLLAFSRKQPVQLQAFQLNDRVSSMHGMLKHLIGEDVVLVTELDEELRIINADPSLLEQAMLNLVVNARDAIPVGGTVTIKTRNVVIDEEATRVNRDAREGEFVCLSVRDTGTGMNRTTCERIFEPFFTTKEKGRGTGLGLSVVYGNVQQHKGWVEVDSELGKGSEFRVYLPIGERESETQERQAPIEQDLSDHSERILVVEDEDVVRDFACKVLRDKGYDVLDVGSAEEGIEVYKQESGEFDAVFSDVVLPGKSGVELVEELLALDPELRILLSSGYTDEKSQWTTINDKGLRFLQKPYSLADLLGTIREVLD